MAFDLTKGVVNSKLGQKIIKDAIDLVPRVYIKIKNGFKKTKYKETKDTGVGDYNFISEHFN